MANIGRGARAPFQLSRHIAVTIVTIFTPIYQPRWRPFSRSAPALLIALITSTLLAAPQIPGTASVVYAKARSAQVDRQLKESLSRQMMKAGSYSGAWVYDATEERVLYARKSWVPRIPASNQKLLLSSAALTRLGASARIETAVYGDGALTGSTWDGDLYLKGQGDPSFGSNSFAVKHHWGIGTRAGKLARAVAATGIKRVKGHVYGDETYFDRVRGVAGTGYGISPYLGPLSGLSFDSGYTSTKRNWFQTNPARFAATRFASYLRKAGVKVSKRGRTGKAPESSTDLATVKSPPLRKLIYLTNKSSDNYFAEILLKHLGARLAGKGSTASGAGLAKELVQSIGQDATVTDGSGLTRSNRISPRALGKLLAYMSTHPDFEALYDSLPVAGKDGTLKHRMRGTAASKRVRAKTGTLSNVSALSGYAETRGGDFLVFSILMNRANTSQARSIQDKMAAAMARYRG